MGFPTSSFKDFADACNEERRSSKLDRFSLIAIVVHDPNNQDFINAINDNYAELNFRIGRDFVYITFCGMPRDYNPLHDDGIPPTENDTDLIQLIQKQFNIEKLPSLIITDSIRSNHYITLASSAEEIFNQLLILGKAASSLKGHYLDEDDIEFMQMHLNRSRRRCFNTEMGLRWEHTPNESSIADIMAETMALYEIEEGTYRRHKWDATCFLNNRLKASQKAISSDSCQSDEHTIQIIERLIMLLSNIYLRLKPNVQRAAYLLREQQFEQCTDSVQNEVRNYNNVAKLFNASNLGIFQGLNLEDFRVLGAALGYIYEAEVNASLVQAARNWLGIPMPEYYCRHDDNLDNRTCVVDTVDLNFYDRAHNSLKNITLGQTQRMINGINRRRNKNCPEPCFSSEYNLPDNIGERITEFSRLRNEACHPGDGIPESRFSYMYNHFCTDMDVYLPIFNEIQRRLSR